MRAVSLDSLQGELAKPGFERELIPLVMYRGQANLGRVQRLWNLSVAMMMHEADSLSEGINRLHLNPEWSHLCFPDRPVQMMGLRGFFNRLRDNPKVTGLVPGFTDYVEWIYPHYWPYERVSIEATRSRCAWWREFVPKRVVLPPPDDFMSVATGVPNHILAEHYGCTAYQVRKWKHELGIEPYAQQPWDVPLDFDQWAPEEVNEELELRYGVSGNVISRWRAETLIQCARRKRGLEPPSSFFEEANGKSILWAMRHFGRSQNVVRRWFNETGAEYETAPPAASLNYPFLLHDRGNPEHELIRLINDAVPKHLPPELRADICQDLAVGCLTGEFDKEDLLLPAKEVAKRVFRMFPSKYGPISLDAPIRDDSDMRLLDTLVDEGRDWA